MNKQVLVGVGILVVLFAVGLIKSSQTEENKNTQVAQASPNAESSIDSKSYPVPDYKVVYELANVRADGGKNYYVLINPIDLSSDSFKEDVRNIVRKIVSENGNKISVDILDDEATMELYYSSHYASNSLGRILNKNEVEQLARHLVAGYSGELEGWDKALDFFPAGSKSTPLVGQYRESMEFDARK